MEPITKNFSFKSLCAVFFYLMYQKRIACHAVEHRGATDHKTHGSVHIAAFESFF